jgi:hypothetical protein
VHGVFPPNRRSWFQGYYSIAAAAVWNQLTPSAAAKNVACFSFPHHQVVRPFAAQFLMYFVRAADAKINLIQTEEQRNCNFPTKSQNFFVE